MPLAKVSVVLLAVSMSATKRFPSSVLAPTVIGPLNVLLPPRFSIDGLLVESRTRPLGIVLLPPRLRTIRLLFSILTCPLPRAAGLVIAISPSLIVVFPESVLVPSSSSVPAPALVSAYAPEMTPEMSSIPPLATVNV